MTSTQLGFLFLNIIGPKRINIGGRKILLFTLDATVAGLIDIH
jgi:hypothetical protein